jgi:uncharacterized protein
MAAALLLAGCSEEPPAAAGPSGPVIDEADVFDAETEAELDARLRLHLDAERTAIIVNTVQSLNGDTIEHYATDRFNTWGVGHAETHRGVLLVLAIDDRKLRIEVGCGVEAELTDAEAGQIIEDVIVPQLREGRYSEAVDAGIEAITAELGDLNDAQGPESPICRELAA